MSKTQRKDKYNKEFQSDEGGFSDEVRPRVQDDSANNCIVWYSLVFQHLSKHISVDVIVYQPCVSSVRG